MESQGRRDLTYQLVIRGELDERFGHLFEGMQIKCAEGTTVLAGRVRDQAKLHGLIGQIEDLGLELVSIRQVAPTATGSG
jgi:hypothetical protein